MKIYKALVIGTGFGGAVSACRLSKKWPNEVLIVERGKRYPLGSFPRKPKDLSENFFNLPKENVRRPKKVPSKAMTGMFDIRSYDHMDVVLGAGFGGGSLVYANVFMEPPVEVFDHRWPETIKKDKLDPYYKVAKEVLGSRPIPKMDGDRRDIIRTKYFQKTAEKLGRKSELVDLNVFFGNNFDQATDLGVQEKNRYGKLQTSCTYCAECCIGCNTQSKNTVDMNYLHVAENRYGAHTLTEHKVIKITPINEDGHLYPDEDGKHGYAVEVFDIKTNQSHTVFAERVVVSAGTLGSNELLLRCRDEYKTLPNISQKLGHGFSGNGDFLSFIGESSEPADPNYGPVITQRVDYNLFENHDPDRAFILEDASYPALLAWFTEGQKPFVTKLSAIGSAIRALWERVTKKRNLNKTGVLFSKLLSDDISWNTSVHLCMGLDKSNGTVSLDKKTSNLDLHWPQKDSMKLYEAILTSVSSFKKIVQAKFWFPMPTWYLKRNVTVHPLGGAMPSTDEKEGVTSSRDKDFGRVHGYQNLYVADGSIVPTAVGANPSATIAALAEKVAHGITGELPDAEL